MESQTSVDGHVLYSSNLTAPLNRSRNQAVKSSPVSIVYFLPANPFIMPPITRRTTTCSGILLLFLNLRH